MHIGISESETRHLLEAALGPKGAGLEGGYGLVLFGGTLICRNVFLHALTTLVQRTRHYLTEAAVIAHWASTTLL